MTNNLIKRSWITILTLTFLLFTISVQAQKRPIAPAMPFDFIDKHYIENGINPDAIIGRRNGYDGLSVFDTSPNPLHNQIRVTATIPAYDVNGGIMYWYPLGEFYAGAFSNDKLGWQARKVASLFPLYVFRDPKTVESYVFADTRQAALLDESAAIYTKKNVNPLGLREIVWVNYTEKAFNSKEGWQMMENLVKKNGYATDKTPIIKTMDDLQQMLDHEMISFTRGDLVESRAFAICPVLYDPTKGAIAVDAFLLMATIGGQPLPSEEIFKWQFECLQKTGEWCQ